jgi:hypothetical protein
MIRFAWLFGDFKTMWNSVSAKQEADNRGNYMFALASGIIARLLVHQFGIGPLRRFLMERNRNYSLIEEVLDYLSVPADVYSDQKIRIGDAHSIDILISGPTFGRSLSNGRHMIVGAEGLFFDPGQFVLDLEAAYLSMSKAAA